MELSRKQRDALELIAEEIGRPDLLDQIVAEGELRTRLLEMAGVKYKSRGYRPWFQREKTARKAPRRFNFSGVRPSKRRESAVHRSMKRVAGK